MTATFDFIIVGGGTAGCVLAARLSADPAHRVLLLEAGRPNRNQLLRIPMTARNFWTNEKYLWNYQSEPEPSVNGRRIPVPRGKILGGSGAINGMLYARGHPRDYDQWRQMGLDGWSFEDVLPHFKRVEHDSRGATPYHGDAGPLAISRTPEANRLTPLFIAAAREAGIPFNDDQNGATSEGMGVPDLTIDRGERASTYSAFLRPAMGRPNLTVETHAQATRLVIERGRATGIEYLRDGKLQKAHAAREIVLSGGAYNSPQLLMLSGIGPADELRAVGITPIHDLPGVGRNLQDHAGVSVINLATQPVSLVKNLRWDRLILNVMQWGVTRSGPVSRMPVVTNGWYRSRPELERPDIQTLIGANSPLAGPWFPGIKQPAPHMFASRSGLQHPESRGWMTLASADPLAAPRIFFNLFSAPGDIAVLRHAIHKVREIFAASPVAHLMGREIMPGPELQTDAQLDQFIRTTTTTAYHPVGTCAMGIDEHAVVDAQLRVRGIAGLRVADASIMPTITGGNTNAPTVMIGDKAAAMILGQELPRAELPSSRLAAE
ncbi:MAG TPA: GMC family oxidoreductase N-terminal domain-containing protein [Stellaceae bacterium]